jgi:hypothetical protein
MSPVAAQAD